MMKELRMDELEVVNGGYGNTMSCDGGGSSSSGIIKTFIKNLYSDDSKSYIPKVTVKTNNEFKVGPSVTYPSDYSRTNVNLNLGPVTVTYSVRN